MGMTSALIKRLSMCGWGVFYKRLFCMFFYQSISVYFVCSSINFLHLIDFKNFDRWEDSSLMKYMIYRKTVIHPFLFLIFQNSTSNSAISLIEKKITFIIQLREVFFKNSIFISCNIKHLLELSYIGFMASL